MGDRYRPKADNIAHAHSLRVLIVLLIRENRMYKSIGSLILLGFIAFSSTAVHARSNIMIMYAGPSKGSSEIAKLKGVGGTLIKKIDGKEIERSLGWVFHVLPGTHEIQIGIAKKPGKNSDASGIVAANGYKVIEAKFDAGYRYFLLAKKESEGASWSIRLVKSSLFKKDSKNVDVNYVEK